MYFLKHFEVKTKFLFTAVCLFIYTYIYKTGVILCLDIFDSSNNKFCLQIIKRDKKYLHTFWIYIGENEGAYRFSVLKYVFLFGKKVCEHSS